VLWTGFMWWAVVNTVVNIRVWKVFDQLRDYQFFRKDSIS